MAVMALVVAAVGVCCCCGNDDEHELKALSAILIQIRCTNLQLALNLSFASLLIDVLFRRGTAGNWTLKQRNRVWGKNGKEALFLILSTHFRGLSFENRPLLSADAFELTDIIHVISKFPAVFTVFNSGLCNASAVLPTPDSSHR
jgi:hypothetical protein